MVKGQLKSRAIACRVNGRFILARRRAGKSLHLPYYFQIVLACHSFPNTSKLVGDQSMVTLAADGAIEEPLLSYFVTT